MYIFISGKMVGSGEPSHFMYLAHCRKLHITTHKAIRIRQHRTTVKFLKQADQEAAIIYKLGFVELCAKILQIMHNDFKDYAHTFCQLFLPLFAKKPFQVLYNTAEYRIDLWDVYGIDKIAYHHLQKLWTFCIAWPDRLH